MSKRNYLFRSPAELDALVASYFQTDLPGPPHASDAKKQKSEPAPLTMSGLAYHLGFDSIREYQICETKRKYAFALKRARLRVEAEYEKKLHFQSSTGAIFALRSFGWTERLSDPNNLSPGNNALTVEIINSGPEVAGEEKDVIL